MGRLNEGERRMPIIIQTKPLEIPTDPESLRKFIVIANVIDENRVHKSFAAYIRDALIREKLSQKNFAKRIGVDHSTISKIVMENRQPTLSTLTGIFNTKYFDDDTIYQIVMDSIPAKIKHSSPRFVFSDEAPPIKDNFQEQLIGYRVARGISQTQLAKRISLEHSTVSRIENEGRNPLLPTLAAIIYGLGLNQKQVLYLVGSH